MAQRKKRGLTLRDMELLTGIKYQQLQRIEAGRNITIKTYERIHKAYCFDLVLIATK